MLSYLTNFQIQFGTQWHASCIVVNTAATVCIFSCKNSYVAYCDPGSHVLIYSLQRIFSPEEQGVEEESDDNTLKNTLHNEYDAFYHRSKFSSRLEKDFEFFTLHGIDQDEYGIVNTIHYEDVSNFIFIYFYRLSF